MVDSGIDIDFTSLLNADDSATEGQYYELKSNTLVQR